MISLTASIVSFIYTFLLCIFFFSRERIDTKENKIFSHMLTASFIGISLDSVSGVLFLTGVNPNSVFYLFLTKCIITFYVVWDMLMLSYIILISHNKEEKKLDWLLEFNSCLTKVLAVIIFILPLKIVQDGNSAYPSGVSIILMYIVTMLLTLVVSSILIKNYRLLKSKKYLPLFAYIAFGILMLIIQNITGVLLMTCVNVFITFLMYFTIENPDVKMIKQLNLAKENAERANDAKTEFLSSMSHEIRTPLNAIVGFSNSILEDKTLEEAKTEAKDIIMASQNLLEIVNGILDISKIEAGKMEIVEVEYNLLDVLNNIKKLIIPRIGEKPIELVANFSPDIPAIVYGDMNKIREIITNLLTNAVKYTEKGIIDLSVQCINTKTKTKLVISVEDTGRGIKPEKIDKLFTKFQRLEEDKNTTLEGTGLGLAITKNLVEMLGGKIVVQSKYGSGSKFTVYLEQKIIKMIDDKPIIEETKTTSIEDYSNKKILIVDDNMLNIKVATRLLKNYKITPDTALSGKDCLDKLKTTTYDLILMDDMMPNMSGTETLKELKKDKKFNTPVVVLTANAISGMKEKYFDAGFTDYLAKPIDKLELNRVLKEYLTK